MLVYVPATALGKATEIYLHSVLEPNPMLTTIIDVSGDRWSYNHYLAAAWSQGQKFVNLEHDVVPWPGAISAIWDCEKDWCMYGFVPGVDMHESGCATFGCVKFSKELIEATRDCWPEMVDKYQGYADCWRYCDIWFYEYATKRGFTPHQHNPPVLNANPSVLQRPPVRPHRMLWLAETDLRPAVPYRV